ncbi:MAG: hypothetical protein EPO21_09985 [Chloroflexota bacterium]|nr:MAG: hypothetical protein EPO21_09985 [Chloroflexota bacterium]
MQDRYIKRLVARAKCGVCGAPYKADNVSVLGHEEEFWFLSIFCETCRNDRLVAALIKPDRAREEAPPKRSVPKEFTPIGYDDVLEMHAFLQQFDGDFRRLFRREREG